jgi:hypothetical protein
MNVQEITLSYPGWQTDFSMAEKLYVEFSSPKYFHEKVRAMQNKQRLFEEDRSHPDIVALDSTELTYEGAEDDKKRAERLHTGDCATIDLGGSFKSFFNRMKKKQALHSGREQIECLRDLDACEFTYTGWKDDKISAETYYVEYDPPSVFRKKLDAMRNKQRLFNNDRSHPDIKKLDSYSFTYEGWEADKEELERRHTGDCFVLDLGTFSFQNLLSTMLKKQEEHEKENNNECLNALASLEVTYPGFEVDKQIAKKYFFEFSAKKPFNDKVEAMRNKQRLWEGDRSHPEIVRLDRANFTYIGWQVDKAEFERRHTGDCSILDLGSYACENLFQRLVKKQEMHTRRRAQVLRDLDTLLPSRGNATLERLNSTCSSATDATEVSSELSGSGETSESDCKTRLCVVCHDCNSTHAFIPCKCLKLKDLTLVYHHVCLTSPKPAPGGHFCVCSDCAARYDASCHDKDMKCPLCRATTMCMTRIFT